MALLPLSSLTSFSSSSLLFLSHRPPNPPPPPAEEGGGGPPPPAEEATQSLLGCHNHKKYQLRKRHLQEIFASDSRTQYEQGRHPAVLANKRCLHPPYPAWRLIWTKEFIIVFLLPTNGRTDTDNAPPSWWAIQPQPSRSCSGL